MFLCFQGWVVGVLPEKLGRGVAHFPKPLPYLWPKSAIFASLFMTWPKIQYPIYDRCGMHSCPEHKSWRAFVDGLIDNDEKVASSKKHMQFKTRVLEPYPIWDQSGQNRYPIYDQNGSKTLHTYIAAHTYIVNIREYPPPTPGAFARGISYFKVVKLRIERYSSFQMFSQYAIIFCNI